MPTPPSAPPPASGSVSVLLAAYNEADAIGPVIEGIRAHTPGLCEVLVVDDGSTDATAGVAARAGAQVLRLARNCGKGHALRHGLPHARGEVVVLLDADGQDDPRDIPRLLDALTAGVDLVIGSRFLGEFGPGAITRVNRAGNRFLTGVLNALFAQRLTDTQAGFKAARRALLERVTLRASRYDIEVDLLLGALAAGARVVEVPVHRAARSAGKSHLHSVRDGLRILRRIVTRRVAG